MKVKGGDVIGSYGIGGSGTHSSPAKTPGGTTMRVKGGNVIDINLGDGGYGTLSDEVSITQNGNTEIVQGGILVNGIGGHGTCSGSTSITLDNVITMNVIGGSGRSGGYGSPGLATKTTLGITGIVKGGEGKILGGNGTHGAGESITQNVITMNVIGNNVIANGNGGNGTHSDGKSITENLITMNVIGGNVDSGIGGSGTCGDGRSNDSKSHTHNVITVNVIGGSGKRGGSGTSGKITETSISIT